MMRWKVLLLGAGLSAVAYAPNAAAQTAEPPRVLPEEPAITAGEALSAAVSTVQVATQRAAVPPAAPEASARLSDALGVASAAAKERPDDEPKAEAPSAEQLAAVQEAANSAPVIDFEPDDFKYTMQMLRRLKRSIDDGVSTVDAATERFRDPIGSGMLDLTPYVADEGWAEVVELLYDDKCKESQRKMEALAGETNGESPVAMQYMWARIQMCSGERTVGEKKLRELAKGEGPVAVLAARRMGEHVIVTEGESGDGEYLSTRIRGIKRGAKKDANGALAQLDELHDEMSRRWDKFKVRQAQAEVLEAAGRNDEAAERYVALYRKTRGWKVNASVEDRIERLERKLGKRILSYGERIDRMRTLISRGRYSEAKQVSVENAKIRGVGGKEIRGWMHYRLALQAEREKDRAKAIELFEKADKLIRDTEVRPRLYFGWARALRRVDQDSKAIALYEKICDEYPKHHLCDESTYEAGRLLQYKNEHERALAKFDTVLKDFPESDHLSEALWRKAFSHYLVGDFDEMIAPLERMRDEFGDEQDESELTLALKATYWLGVAHLKAGARPEAEAQLQATIDMGPMTWYGRLAAARMVEAGWSPSIRLPTERLTKSDLENLATLRVPQSPRLRVAGEYVRLGLWKEALEEMRDQVAIHPVPRGAHRLLASTYLANGRPDWAHWIMKDHIDQSNTSWGSLRDWGTAFPLNYMEFSHKFGTEAGVSPFLVQAIIRQESGFRPTVKSWAGAIGLMQLMPRTASYVHRVFLEEKRSFQTRELREPEKNVKLGAKYIRIHTAHAKESVPLALAGYNAGPAPLESWVERYGDRELDAFVESITYREARGYVRKVYTSFITYSALYSGEYPDISLEVPNKLRRFGQVPEVASVKEGEPVSVLQD